MRCVVITIFDENVFFGSCSGGGGGGTEIRLNCRCMSFCDFSDGFIPVSPGDGSIEFVLYVTIPSFEVVVSLWLSFALGMGMSTKDTVSFIPLDVCASSIWSEMVSILGASTEKYA